MFVTEFEFDNTDKRGLVLNDGMYHEFLHIDQWNGI